MSDWEALVELVRRAPWTLAIPVVLVAMRVGRWWGVRQQGLVRPPLGAPRRDAWALRAALRALDRPDGTLRVRDGAAEGVDLVAELTVPTSEDGEATETARALLRFDDRWREVRSSEELIRTTRVRSGSTGSSGSVSAPAGLVEHTESVPQSHPEMAQMLRRAVLGAGWTWRDLGYPRPRWLRAPWSVLGYLVFIVLAAPAAAGVAVSVSDAGPTTEFESGEVVATHLDPAGVPSIRVSEFLPDSFACGVASPASLVDPEYRSAPGTEWPLAFRIDVPRPGEYQLACVGEGLQFQVGPDWSVAVQDAIWSRILLPAVGVFFSLGTGVLLTIAERRSAHHRRHRAGRK